MSLTAVIDLGTNTFHLLVAEITEDQTIKPWYEEKQAARLGKGGIGQGIIAPEAWERGIQIMKLYQQIITDFGILPSAVKAIGTSAIRNASNGSEFVEAIRQETGIHVQVITGDREAELIYAGVRKAVPMPDSPSLILDIGGGSVECILGNAQRIFWKQSFEIGGQRLIDRFMQADPIAPEQVQRLYDFLEEKLLPLTNAVHQYQPKLLIGSSGAFDTLVEMHEIPNNPDFFLPNQTSYDLPIEAFRHSFQDVITKDHTQRLAITGMAPIRADMIVVACCLIDFVLRKYTIPQIKTSIYALKEGVLSEP